ncbi:hypothetical protein BrevBR_08400 [Brevundimonas sp. BR2-1]|uniref:hypothetical protein n=1 Tax=Brevundimonas sp. BR2-1 TaxID=3031123 RepID=UPI0030AB6498
MRPAPTSSAHEFASGVALDLRETEHLLDAASARLADMLASAFHTRGAANLGAAAGQKAFNAAAKALHTLTAARGELVEAHGHAERDARRMGLNYSLLIPGESKPEGDETAPATPTGRLAAV